MPCPHCSAANQLTPAGAHALQAMQSLPGYGASPPFMQCIIQALAICLQTSVPAHVGANWYPGCILLETLKCLTAPIPTPGS